MSAILEERHMFIEFLHQKRLWRLEMHSVSVSRAVLRPKRALDTEKESLKGAIRD